MTDEAYLLWLSATQGYHDPKLIREGRMWAAITDRLFGAASIIIGRVGDCLFVEGGWDYPSLPAATAALLAWDGEGEPEGWIRHPASGRRVCQTPGEYDEKGRLVPIGELYTRP